MTTTKPYWQKLQDPRWQRLRLEVMQRDEFKCLECASERKTLNVHHKRYRKGAEPWEYPAADLVTLCQPCHEKVEALRSMLLEQIGTPSDYQRALRTLGAINGTVPFYDDSACGLMAACQRVLDACEACSGLEDDDPCAAVEELALSIQAVRNVSGSVAAAYTEKAATKAAWFKATLEALFRKGGDE